MAPQFKTAVTNVPPLTKALLSGVVVTTGMAYVYLYRQSPSSPHCPVLGLVPGFLMSAPWTIVTSLFFENTPWTFLSSLLILLLCGKYLERAWGSREFLTFIAVVGVGSNVITWLGLVLTFYLTGDDHYLYGVQINGLAGLFAAFLVAFKSLIPEHRISLLGGVVAIRVKNLLSVATVISILCLVVFRALVFYNLVNIGWVIGWIYLRFFRVQEGGMRGDRSEAFALVTFFPDFLSPVIGGLSNVVYQLFVSCHLCPPVIPTTTMYDMEQQVSSSRQSLTPLPGSARAEAERRRALALKALDMRLSTKSPSSTSTAAPPQPATTPPSASSTTNDVLFDATSEITKE